MAMRALITGAAGFIGSNLVRTLADYGWEVHAVIRPGSSLDGLDDMYEPCTFQVYDGSAESMLTLMHNCRPCIVFHLASLYISEHQASDITPLIESNVILGSHLAEAMVATGCKKLVNVGTSWQHYHSDEYRPVNLYAATKQAFEDILSYYHDAHALSCITLKLFDTYGVDDRRRKLMAIIVDAALSGDTIDMSPGEQTVDLSHVSDVVNALIEVAEFLVAQPSAIKSAYFVGGERMTVRELVALIANVLQRPVHANFGGRPYRTREVMVLPARSERMPFWESRSAKRSLARELPTLAGVGS